MTECDMREPSEERWLGYLTDTMAKVERFGFAIQAVLPNPGEDGRPFAYTVGLTTRDRPEMVVTGLGPEQAHRLLWGAFEGQLEERYVRRVPVVTTSLGVALRLYGDRVRAEQLILADDLGRFPGDPGCESEEWQPLLEATS